MKLTSVIIRYLSLHCKTLLSSALTFSAEPSLVLSSSEKFWFIRSTEAHKMLKPNPEVRVSAVSVIELRVPPFSAQVIKCEIDAKVGHFLLEPVSRFQGGLLFALSLISPGERGKV